MLIQRLCVDMMVLSMYCSLEMIIVAIVFLKSTKINVECMYEFYVRVDIMYVKNERVKRQVLCRFYFVVH